MRLAHKTLLVTAAGQGIGHAAVLAMAAEGATVWATDVNPSLLNAFAGQPHIHTAPLDVMDKAAIHALVQRMGVVDAVFNCAGVVHSNTALNATDEQWDFAMDLNARSQFWMIQAVLPGMIERGGGSIINMASVASSLKGLPNRLVYGTSKAAVIGMTKAVAADHVTQGVRCNAICPGTVDTPSLQDRINSYADPVQARKDFINRQPMGRLATVDDIAPLVVFLLSDASRFITGQAVSVDGALMA